MAEIPVCRLCLEIVCDNIFEPVRNLISELECILPNLDYNITPDPIVCGKCKETVHKAVCFKTACVDTDKYLRNLRTGDNTFGQLFNQISKDNLVKQEGGKGETCRLCLRMIEDESYTQLTALEYVLRKCLPEMDLTLVQTPFICSACVEELQSFVNFIMLCLDVEDRIKMYFNSEDAKFSKRSLHDLLASSFKIELDRDNFNRSVGVKIEPNDMPVNNTIKQEEVFIKHEFEDIPEGFQDGNALYKTLPHQMDHCYVRTLYPISDSFSHLLHRYRNCNKGYVHRSKLMARKIKAVKRNIRLLEKKVKCYQKIVKEKFEKLEAVTTILQNLKKDNLLSDDAYVALMECSNVSRNIV